MAGIALIFDIFCGTLTQINALDLACGTGHVTTTWAEIGLECTGIATCTPMLHMAKQKENNRWLGITYLNRDMGYCKIFKKFDLITMAGNSV
jgi:2-polyprenyl-3-methyl-5-hydroxy-6-metoxy-1,4-benzoquinol methylase